MKKLARPGIATEPEQRCWSNQGSVGDPGYAGIDAVEELKRCLLQEYAREVSDSALLTCLRQVTEEAASLARATDYPLLILPELFAERAAEAFIEGFAARAAERNRGMRCPTDQSRIGDGGLSGEER